MQHNLSSISITIHDVKVVLRNINLNKACCPDLISLRLLKEGATILSQPLLTLNAPITTKVACFSRLLKCLRSLYGKQCGPRSDCSYRSSPFWVHAVCFYTNSSVMLGNYLQQTTSAGDIFRCIFFLGALRVNNIQSFF